jgi:hypothetical protein
MLRPFHDSRSVVAAALLAIVQMSAQAQSAPLAPTLVVAQRAAGGSGSNVWRIGPISLNLPSAWGNPSKPSGVVWLHGSEGTAASFTVLSATEAARSSGYSILADARRGPESFARYLQWEDCQGPPERTVRSLATPTGSSALYAQCSVEARPGATATFTQVTLYSKSHLVQIQVLGNEQETARLLAALQAVSWSE